MSERLETLKKARARMIEDRDVHAKVISRPKSPAPSSATCAPLCCPAGDDIL